MAVIGQVSWHVQVRRKYEEPIALKIKAGKYGLNLEGDAEGSDIWISDNDDGLLSQTPPPPRVVPQRKVKEGRKVTHIEGLANSNWIVSSFLCFSSQQRSKVK